MGGPLHDKEPSLVYLKTDHARCFVLFSWCLQHNDVVEVAGEFYHEGIYIDRDQGGLGLKFGGGAYPKGEFAYIVGVEGGCGGAGLLQVFFQEVVAGKTYGFPFERYGCIEFVVGLRCIEFDGLVVEGFQIIAYDEFETVGAKFFFFVVFFFAAAEEEQGKEGGEDQQEGGPAALDVSELLLRCFGRMKLAFCCVAACFHLEYFWLVNINSYSNVRNERASKNSRLPGGGFR